MPGRFIVIEGPDGAGTTTHSKLLAEALRAKGRDVLLTAEPTSGPIGTFTRTQLSAKTIPSPSALQLLFCADRAAHVQLEIVPALAAGTTVVCDRYALSTLVYGEALGLDRQWLERVNAAFPKPDVHILALPGLETALKRVGMRSNKDVFEQDTFQRKVYALYEQAAAQDASIAVVNTGGTLDKAAQQIFTLASA